MTKTNNIVLSGHRRWAIVACCAALALAGVARAAAAEPNTPMPKGCWSVAQAEKLERAIDVFLAQEDAEKQRWEGVGEAE